MGGERPGVPRILGGAAAKQFGKQIPIRGNVGDGFEEDSVGLAFGGKVERSLRSARRVGWSLDWGVSVVGLGWSGVGGWESSNRSEKLRCKSSDFPVNSHFGTIIVSFDQFFIFVHV